MDRSSVNVLEIHDVTISSEKGAKTSPWLRDASFSIRRSEIIAVVGPNGAGKSSLLKVLSGEHSYYSGEIKFNTQNLRDWDISRLAQCRAVLPQQSALSFPYTVREVIALGRAPHRTGQIYDSKIVDSVINALDLKTFEHRSYTQLSGGEKQRCQLARVFTQIWSAQIWSDKRNAEYENTHKLLLLDEPLNALDLGHQQQVLKLLKKIAQTGTTILIVLHDLNRALNIADKILLLNQGQIAAYGTPESVLNETLLSKVFSAEIKIRHIPDSSEIWITS